MRGIAIIALVLLASPAWPAGGAPQPDEDGPETVDSADRRRAVEHYNAGLRHRDRGDRFRQQAAETGEPRKQNKRQAKAADQYAKAAEHFNRALHYRDDFYQALASLGYVYRRLGDSERSLAAYERSLQINPVYGEAIEYRAEAYLRLNRLEDAKQAYMVLFRSDRWLADRLMAAMEAWLLDPAARDGAVPQAELASFAAWVNRRRELAGRTTDLRAGQERTW